MFRSPILTLNKQVRMPVTGTVSGMWTEVVRGGRVDGGVTTGLKTIILVPIRYATLSMVPPFPPPLPLFLFFYMRIESYLNMELL